MRFFDLSASAIAAAALLQGAVASEQPKAYPAAPAGVTSAATTYYTTLTVFRVETTVTATRNGSVTAYPSTSTETSIETSAVTSAVTSVVVPTTLASATIPSYGNGTSVRPTGVPTGIIPSTGAASGLQACAMAVAAVAGMASLWML